jgi:hypothetical protein
MTGHQELWTSRSPAQDRSGPRPIVTAPASHQACEPQESLAWRNSRGSLRVVGADAAPHAGQIVTADQ